jgi:hypothetical protein
MGRTTTAMVQLTQQAVRDAQPTTMMLTMTPMAHLKVSAFVQQVGITGQPGLGIAMTVMRR